MGARCELTITMRLISLSTGISGRRDPVPEPTSHRQVKASVPPVDGNYVALMEDLLALYGETSDLKGP